MPVSLDSGFRRRCEAIAVNWRHRFGLQPFDALPAERLLKELDGSAMPPDQVPFISPPAAASLLIRDDWSAATIRRKPLLIIYNPAHSAARHQSNLMHEIAHVLLDHPMATFDPESGLPLRNPQHEREAEYLGGCLQIPRLGLLWAIQRGYTDAEITTHFGASDAMLRYRSNMTGIRFT